MIWLKMQILHLCKSNFSHFPCYKPNILLEQPVFSFKYVLPLILNHKLMFFSISNISNQLWSMVLLSDIISVILLAMQRPSG